MSVALASSSTPNPARQEPLRVMVVDDSVVIRGLIARWIGSEPDMVVAASLRTGLDAVNQIERVNPDVAVLDIERPELDGISALPQLLAKKRNLIIIMASTLTRRNAEISFKALSLGASDYIPKPESTREAAAADIFHHDLIQKIRHLGAKVRRPAREAVDGEIVRAGQIYLAPGGRHMRVVRHGADAAIALDDGPPVNFCKPAVDPLFTSAIDVWQAGIMSVILTGMGSDGMRGGKDIVAAGGSVIAQDEATSVVWGMPGAATHAGICAAVLPLGQMAPKLIQLFAGVRS